MLHFPHYEPLVLPPGRDGMAAGEGVDVTKEQLDGPVAREELVENVPAQASFCYK